MTRFLIFLLLVGCANFRITRAKKPVPKNSAAIALQKKDPISKMIKKKIPRTGIYSTVTDGDITTEIFRREDSESIFTLEKNELRTETEKMKNGVVLTRTWQDDLMTTLTLTGSKRTTMVVFDKDGDYTQKIVTEKGKERPECFQYEGGKPVKMEEDSCLELISGF